MENVDMSNVYILNNGKSNTDLNNKTIIYHYNNKPLIIKTEEGTETAYIPSFENGELVIKPIATEYVEKSCLEIEGTNIKQEVESDAEKIDTDDEDNLSHEDYLVEYLDEEFLENRDPLFLNNHDLEDVGNGGACATDPSNTETESVAYIRNQIEDHNVLPSNSKFMETNLYPEEPLENEIYAVFEDGYFENQESFRDVPCTTNDIKKTTSSSVLKQQPVINKRPIVLGNQKIKPNISIPNAIACRNTLKPNQKYLLDGGLIRMGRKHLIVDIKTMIGPLDFKKQLMDSADLVQPIQLAPCTKKEIHKKMHGLHYFFGNPTSRIPSDTLSQRFQRHCTTRKQPNTETITDMELLPLGAKQTIDLSKIKRITRRRKYADPERYQREKNEKLKELQQTTLLKNQLLTGPENMEIVINSDEILKLYNPNIPTSSNGEQVFVIHDGQEETDNINAYTQKNIEVLLAAAAESNSSPQYQQIFVCEDNIYTQENAGKVFVSDNNQIFIVQDDIGQLFQTSNDIL